MTVGKRQFCVHFFTHLKRIFLCNDALIVQTGEARRWIIKLLVNAVAVSRWLPTTAAEVYVRAVCGVCGGQSGSRFSPSTSASLVSHHSTNFSIIIITRGTTGLLVAAVRSGPNWTPPPTMPIKKVERMWNELIIPYFKANPSISRDELTRSTKFLVEVPRIQVGIRTERLQNTNTNYCRLDQHVR
jgi:hypothetical protein